MNPDTNGTSTTHFWWVNHVDRRFHTVLAYDAEDAFQGQSVMDDFGALVLIDRS